MGAVSPKAGIARRIMFMAWLIAILTVMIFAAATVYSQRRAATQRLETNGLLIASRLSTRLLEGLQSGEGLGLIEGTDFVDSVQEVDYVAWTSPTASRLVRMSDANWNEQELKGEIWVPSDTGLSEQKLISVENPLPGIRHALHYRQAFHHEDVLLGWIHVGVITDDYLQSAQQAYALAGYVVLPIIGLSALVSLFFAREITKPIKALQTYARAVATGSLSTRVTLNTNDEFAELAESMNLMVENLQNSQVRLKDTMEQKQAMREQEILLREIHHRVKNNMQILTSLLRLQTRRTESEQLRAVLKESEGRIRSMGLLHEKLYQSESVSEIDIAGYLQTLTSELVRMNTPQGEKREIRLAVRGIKMGLDTALPCGLIVTELVSNSLKYAFPPGREGVILISLGRSKEREYTLVVWDNGVGLPDNYQQRQEKSLGSRLVSMLTDQLNGELKIAGNNGTRIEIRFKESQYQRRI